MVKRVSGAKLVSQGSCQLCSFVFAAAHSPSSPMTPPCRAWVDPSSWWHLWHRASWLLRIQRSTWGVNTCNTRPHRQFRSACQGPQQLGKHRTHPHWGSIVSVLALTIQTFCPTAQHEILFVRPKVRAEHRFECTQQATAPCWDTDTVLAGARRRNHAKKIYSWVLQVGDDPPPGHPGSQGGRGAAAGCATAGTPAADPL